MKEHKNNEYFNKIAQNLDKETADLLMYDVNDILYNYSDHQIENTNSNYGLGFHFKKLIHQCLIVLFYLKNVIFFKLKQKQTIMSNAYVNVNLYGADVIRPPWVFTLKGSMINSIKILLLIEKIKRKLNRRSIKYLFSKEFKSILLQFEAELIKGFRNYNVSAVIFPNDMAFFENFTIKVAKRYHIPSFVYLHGLPARYNDVDDNRADYLVVWGNGLKKEYINAGVQSDKVLTLKHPTYSNFKQTTLTSTLDHVLVLTKPISGVPCISTELVLPKRSIILYYLELVKENLQRLGVTKANLRLHPSESKAFYADNLVDDFFTINESSKQEALSAASLIIGPSSTMLLDAIKAGKNYILFDPILNGNTLEGIPLVKPFTGDSFIQLSNTFEQIKFNIDHPSSNIDFEKLNVFFKVEDSDLGKFYALANIKKQVVQKNLND